MPMTVYRISWFLCGVLILFSCHTTRTESGSNSKVSNFSQLHHVDGTIITTTVECLADIDTTGASPRFIPRPYTPAKLTIKKRSVSLADTTTTNTSCQTIYDNSKEHVRNLSTNFEPFRITTSTILIIVLTLLSLFIYLGCKRHQ